MLCTVSNDGMIRVSVGTAAALGLVNMRCDVLPSTAYLLTTGGCMSQCAFCAQARSSKTSEALLSRVSWPEFPVEQVIEAHAKGNSVLQQYVFRLLLHLLTKHGQKELSSDILKVRQRIWIDYEISLYAILCLFLMWRACSLWEWIG